MALRFSFFAYAAVWGLLGITSAEFDYNPNLYNTNNSNNNNNIETPNIKGYDDNIQQPANSYNAPLTALNTYNNTAKKQQQQPPVNGYNYDVTNAPQSLANNYKNNTPQQSQQKQQQQQQPQQSQRNNYGYAKGAESQPTNGIATPAGYDYKSQNYAAPPSSSSPSGSVSTSTNIETSLSSQGRQIFAPAAASVEEYNPPAKYEYNYNVHDDDTGDIKSHNEARDGYFVQGSYSVIDPDGFQRTVRYTVDGPSGFNAVVYRVPYALKPVAAAVGLSAPPTSAAPIANKAELPLSNSASLEQSSPASASSTSTSEHADSTNINLPMEPRDSYATPPSTSRDGEGPYP